MTYFTNLPYATFEFNSSNSVVKDILKRSMFISEHKPYTDLYEVYNIQDGETIQSVAKRFYDSASYHWVIAIVNELHDMQYEWPIGQHSLEILCDDKYGTDKTKTKYWIDSRNVICGEYKDYYVGYIEPLNPGVEGNFEYTRITFEEYETIENDAKRIIHILKPELLGDFVSQYRASLNG